MKKLFILSVAAILVLAYGLAYAQAPTAPVLDFKASGYLNTEYTWGRNIRQNIRFNYHAAPPGEFDSTIAYIKTRGRLMFNANMGKELSGTIYFEMDADPYGAAPGSSSQGSLQRNDIGYWGADRAAVEVKWLFFDVAVPVIPVPITLRIGEQGWGPRPMMFSGDAPGITAGIKIDPAQINLFWAKALEGEYYRADDSDLYGAEVKAKIDKLTVGGYAIYYNFNRVPLSWNADQTVAGTQAADFWYLGAYADGKVGPVNISFDFIYDNGKVKSRLTPTAQTIKYSGWTGRLVVDYPWDKFNFGAGVFYGSGDDKSKTYKKNGWVNPPATETNGPFDEAMIFYSANITTGSMGVGNFGPTNTFANVDLGGTWFAKVYAKAKVTPAYTITAKAYYIGDTTKNGDTYGTLPGDHKFIGWEFDLINTIMLYKNLRWEIGGGILPFGNAFNFVDNHYDTRKPKTAWTICGNLTYTF